MTNNKIHVVETDGVLQVLQPPDLDNDGQIGSYEKVKQKFDTEVIAPKETSELGDVITKAFEDKIDPDTKTSTMDMLANIKAVEEVYVFVINSLVSLDFLPPDILMATRMKLRLSNSRDARGRNDIRDISIGKRANDISMKQGMSNFAGMNVPK